MPPASCLLADPAAYPCGPGGRAPSSGVCEHNTFSSFMAVPYMSVCLTIADQNKSWVPLEHVARETAGKNMQVHHSGSV